MPFGKFSRSVGGLVHSQVYQGLTSSAESMTKGMRYGMTKGMTKSMRYGKTKGMTKSMRYGFIQMASP